MPLYDSIRRITPGALHGALDALRAVYRREVTAYRVRRQFGGGGRIPSGFATLRALVAPRHTVLFYPEFPRQSQLAYKACVLNGYRLTNNLRREATIVHKHADRSVDDPHPPVLAAGDRAINAAANDIRKQTVQQVFEEVFGYALAIDPRTHRGRAVRKSDANCKHDGEIVECPREAGGEDVVYQRLVETDNGRGYAVDHRVPILDGEIPLVYLKYRPIGNRFETFTSAEIVEPDAVFSPAEQSQLVALAQALGTEFSEMDVLRDNGDGRIYVVDVNNTPSGPPAKLDAEGQRRAAATLAKAYRQMVERRAARARA